MKSKIFRYLVIILISFLAIYSFYIFKTQSISQWWSNNIIFSLYFIILVLGTVKNIFSKDHSYINVLTYSLTLISSLILMVAIRYNYQFKFVIVIMISAIIALINELYNLFRKNKNIPKRN